MRNYDFKLNFSSILLKIFFQLKLVQHLSMFNLLLWTENTVGEIKYLSCFFSKCFFISIFSYVTGRELISHDIRSNKFNYKHTFSVEIVPICKVSASTLDLQMHIFCRDSPYL